MLSCWAEVVDTRRLRRERRTWRRIRSSIIIIGCQNGETVRSNKSFGFLISFGRGDSDEDDRILFVDLGVLGDTRPELWP